MRCLTYSQREFQEKVQYKLAIQGLLRDQKNTEIRLRKFQEEREREKASRRLQKQFNEEQMYRSLFLGALRKQKERLVEERQLAVERRKELEQISQSRFQAIENLYDLTSSY